MGSTKNVHSNEPRCRKCGSRFIGNPWDVRICSGCDAWMAPDYFHPDAPKERRVEGACKLSSICRLLTGDLSTPTPHTVLSVSQQEPFLTDSANQTKASAPLAMPSPALSGSLACSSPEGAILEMTGSAPDSDRNSHSGMEPDLSGQKPVSQKAERKVS